MAPNNRDMTLIAIRRSRLGQSGGVHLYVCGDHSNRHTCSAFGSVGANSPSLTARGTTATDRFRLVPRSGRYGVDGRGSKRLRAGSGKWIAACAAVRAIRDACKPKAKQVVGRGNDGTGNGSLMVVDDAHLIGGIVRKVIAGEDELAWLRSSSII